MPANQRMRFEPSTIRISRYVAPNAMRKVTNETVDANCTVEPARLT